ncbi:MAG: hypothetical protein M3Z50_02390 [Actinomycetota bacterium]|nr:hypothetical protein [Actinomycetota bacterium]
MPAFARTRRLAASMAALLAGALTMTLLVGLLSSAPAEVVSRSYRIAAAVHVARNQIGDGYRYGAAGPNSFDCSGLTYAFHVREGFRYFRGLQVRKPTSPTGFAGVTCGWAI